jgi:hypothetical protein
VAVIVIVAAAVLGSCFLLAAINNFTNGDQSPTGDAQQAAATKKASRTAGLNTPVRDGKFEFTVTGLDCGHQTVGSGFSTSTAQGEYCLLDVSVRNIGKESQSFTGSDQTALDGAGREYSDDTGAELDANTGTQTWSEDINPGNGVNGLLVFDVPAGTKLTTIELHDSMFSRGVKVRLS